MLNVASILTAGISFQCQMFILWPYYVKGLLNPVGTKIWYEFERYETQSQNISEWIHSNDASSLPFQSGLIRWSWTAALIPRTCTEIRVCLNPRRALSSPPPPSSAWSLRCVFPLVCRRAPSVHFSNNNDRVGGPVAATNKERDPAGDPTVTFISKSWNPDSGLIVITHGLCFFFAVLHSRLP